MRSDTVKQQTENQNNTRRGKAKTTKMKSPGKALPFVLAFAPFAAALLRQPPRSVSNEWQPCFWFGGFFRLSVALFSDFDTAFTSPMGGDKGLETIGVIAWLAPFQRFENQSLNVFLALSMATKRNMQIV
jgi:hypothetical protein